MWQSTGQISLKGQEPRGYAVYDSEGMLAHQDVRALRRSKLVLFYPMMFPHGLEEKTLKEGTIVNIVSDGTQIRVTDKLTGEEIF